MPQTQTPPRHPAAGGYYRDDEDDGLMTTAIEAGRPVRTTPTTSKPADPTIGGSVMVRSARGAMRQYTGTIGTVESIGSAGMTVRFADGNTRTVRASEVTATA